MTTLFDRLRESSIPSLIIRGGSELPNRLTGNDIDIFVPSHQLKEATILLVSIMREQHIKWVHLHRRSYFSAFWFLEEGNSDHPPLHIDLYPGAFTWKGLSYLTDDEVLQGASIREGFPFPSPIIETCSLLLTSLLWGGFYKERYAPRIKQLIADPKVRQQVAIILQQRFLVSDELLQQVESDHLEGHITHHISWKLRKGLLVSRMKVMPLKASISVAKFLLDEVKSWLRPPGLCIAILGPDGAGKSLLLHNLIQQIQPYFGAIQTFHWRPQILTDIGVLLGRRESASNEPVTNPHEKSAHSAIPSLLRFLYYLADYWLGWIIKVWPGKARNHLVIFDRYIYDMFIDPRRYRMGLSQRLLQFLSRFAPRPDLTIVLDAPAEVLMSRKQEVSMEELERTLDRLRSFVSAQLNGVHRIDCSVSKEEVCSTASNQILAALCSRIR